MGSLMAGWNCPVVDPEKAWLERNRSLTKEDIDSFWKEHRKSFDGEDLALSPRSPAPRSPLGGEEEGAGRREKSAFWKSLEKSKTFLPAGHHNSDSPAAADDTVAKLTGDWWTRSNWAFLNEPPHDEVEESAHRYAAQFHVAEIATAAAAAATTKQEAH